MKKIHVLLIHGGMTFKTKKDYIHYLKTRSVSLDKRVSWTGDYLDKALGRKFEVIRPQMPIKQDAKYAEWKIWFERYLPLLNKDFILIGNSLGGIFLAKYLSENKLKRPALKTFLVCPPFDGSLSSEDLVGGFKLGRDLSLIHKNTKKLVLFFSQDDDVVPVAHAEKYRAKLPDANIKIFKSKNGHFFVTTFPEIVKAIKENVGKK